MKIEFESKDIEAIAQKVTELVRPLLSNVGRNEDKNHIFDIEGLAEYLHVAPAWIYRKVSLKAIPYFKVGKYPRFRKKDIDKWIGGETVEPVPMLKLV